MKRKLRNLLCLIIVGALLISMTEEVSAGEKDNGSKQITYMELPDEYKEFIQPNSTIFQEADGSYSIVQNEISDKIICSKDSKYETQAAGQRYAPNGGTYDKLEKGKLSWATFIVYQTYLPRDIVDVWISKHNNEMTSYIKGLFVSLGATKLDKIAAQVLKRYGIGLTFGAIIMIVDGVTFTLDWLNYTSVMKASNNGTNGILIEYITTIAQGNTKYYKPWKSTYVPAKPYGGSARWSDAVYSIMP